MGYAVAQAAAESGAKTILVSGPTSLPVPPRVQCENIKSAQQMRDVIMDHIGECDIFISAAAVADYRVAEPSDQKIKKQNEEIFLQLVRNPDVLAEVAKLKDGPFTVGFAAETENLEENAKQKLQNKNLDMVAANLVGENKAFDQEENALLVFSNKEQHELPQTHKDKLARQLISIIASVFQTNQS